MPEGVAERVHLAPLVANHHHRITRQVEPEEVARLGRLRAPPGEQARNASSSASLIGPP
jgi:hypothetical protein